MVHKNPPAKEDTWAFQPIGAPFPPNPIKVMGQQNLYVALWYKHGKPIHGRSWNNGGVVECSFPYKKAELKTKEQLEGQIQVLQYQGDHNTQGFWYEWIQYKDRLHKADGRELVHCGDSFPIFWKDSPERPLLGFVDKKTELAQFSAKGKVLEKSGEKAIGNMYIIMRKFIGGPPFCECPNCPKPPPPPPAALFGEKEWHPVHVNHHKGDISPGVITVGGKQILGKCDVRNEKASAGFGGHENVLTGPACAKDTIVLCRKAKPGYKFD